MLIPAILMTLGLSAPVQAADTTVPVERGTRLEVDNHAGEVVVTVWDRDAVRVRADLSSRQVSEVTRSGSVLRVRPRTLRGGPQNADLALTIPRWMDVRVEGNQLDVEVRGTDGEIGVETVGGDIVVEGGAGRVSLRTIQGEILLRGGRGRVEAESVNDDITLIDIGGDVYVQGTNGDIAMRGMRSTSVRATTVNGDVSYEGTIRDNGRYALSTHNGDLTIGVPQGANATVSVSTYHGEFESEFPVRLTGTGPNRQFNFTLGSGSARVELESFNGEIRLRRR